METISNLASTATTTVSNLIYGEPAKNNETAGKEPVSGQTGKGTVEDPYDQGNSEAALDKNTAPTTSVTDKVESALDKNIPSTSQVTDRVESALGQNTASTTSVTEKVEPTREVEPTGSIQKPEDLLNAYSNAAGDSTTTGSGFTTNGVTDKPSSTATGITDKAGVTDTLWKPTDVDSVKPSVTDPAAAPETGAGLDGSSGQPAAGGDTLWRGVDAYKNTSSTGPTSAGLTSTGPTSTGLTSTGLTSTGPTSTGPTIAGNDLTRLTSSESTSGGPKGAIDAEPKNYSIGDLTSGKETPPKPVDNTTSSVNPSSKTGESAIAPPDLSTTSPENTKPNFTADTHQPSHSTGLVGEKAGSAGPASTAPAPANHSSSISPSGDDDEKSGKMSALKDKLKNKLHIGSKDH